MANYDIDAAGASVGPSGGLSSSRRVTIGILAHVDAGKTTLSEALLHLTGAIRSAGRVDHGDAFLDTDVQERKRGITIFSKQAVFSFGDTVFTLLDTPGHVDFSAETERTLQVLDAAVLVISAPEGVQSHTRTLFSLLRRYRVPTFVFVNKMDQPGAKKDRVLSQLNLVFKGGFFDFSEGGGLLDDPEQQEALAVLDEALLQAYLEDERPVDQSDLCRLFHERKLFPCVFGSALREEGVETLLKVLSDLAGALPEEALNAPFGARVFKITRDEQGQRLTWLKVTGGVLRAKMVLNDAGEKAEQLRLYSGTKFRTLKEAGPGTVAAVTGLSGTRAGQGLGAEPPLSLPLLSPVLSYAVALPDGVDAAEALPRFRSLEEELPELHTDFDEAAKEIRVRIMGEVQTEILKELVKARFGWTISFQDASISYRETIASKVEGVGHFEPLRHYAEVHLILEPGEPGSGLVFDSIVSSDRLATNWQRLILTHLEEREHKGVLTGSPITDMKITLAAGKAHEKHTEGGDFRQATYRAVRNGLMEAENVLLEPWYSFTLTLPQSSVGRAFTDLDRMGAKFSLGSGEDDTGPADGNAGSGNAGFGNAGPGDPDTSGLSTITGTGPVSELRNYAGTLRTYTGGRGTLSLSFAGYYPCHNADEVIAGFHYEAELDLRNTADSVFCSHGSGTVIPWYEVKQYMHLPPVLSPDGSVSADGDPGEGEAYLSSAAIAARQAKEAARAAEEPLMSIDEIDAIIERTFFSNRKGKDRKRAPYGRPRRAKETLDYASSARSGGAGTKAGTDTSSGAGNKSGKAGNVRARKEYLLVDGYNIIFAWEELRELAKLNVDSAREALLDILCDYQGHMGCTLIAVFDAYRVKGHPVEILDYYNIHVVYTKEAQTADSYIEQFSEEHAKTDRVIVATSDGMEQIIVRSAGSELMSAADLKDDIIRRQKAAKEALEQRPYSAGTGVSGKGSAGTGGAGTWDVSAAPKNRPFAEKLKALKDGTGKEA